MRVETKTLDDQDIGIEGLSPGVLEEYQFELKVLFKHDNHWLLEGKNQKFALWNYKMGDKETELVLECLGFLNMNDCKSLPRLYKTDKGARSVRKDGKTLFLSSIPTGEVSPSTKNPNVQSLCSALSDIHEKSALWKGLTGHNNEFGYIGKLQGMLYELLQYKTILQDKRFHSDFELIFLEYFDLLYSQGQESLEIMNMAGFGCPNMQAAFLLNSFLPRTIFFIEQQYSFSDLHRIGFGPRVMDLALLLKTFMPLYVWNQKILKEAIEVYQKTEKLSFDERHVLIAQLRFPGRYWLYALWYLRGSKNSQELALLLKNYILEWNKRDKSLDAVQTWLLGE